MPRPPRIQFPDACYHVINRGNYRSDIFVRPRTAAAFEACLFETCDRMGWVLYAYVIMRNHFHLAIRTPQANLAVGMHWLSTTFATRFNRLRGERGHLFQGRYHAALVEQGNALVHVINYIHLNPVRAKAVTAEQLMQFRHSSLRWFAARSRPDFLVCHEWLRILGFADTRAGWQSYRAYLAWLAADSAEQKRQKWETSGTSWAVGSLGWRKSMRQACRTALGRHLLSPEENARLNHEEWAHALHEALRQERRTLQEASDAPKGADWKLRLVTQLRRATSVTIPWLAHMLHMGSPSSVRAYLARHEK